MSSGRARPLRAPSCALTLAALVAACSRSGGTTATTTSAARGEPAAPAPSGDPAAGSAPHAVAIDALGTGPEGGCSFGHRGVLLDLGDATTRARLLPSDRAGRVEPIEREGSTWARVVARGASIGFVATADDVAAGTADGAVPVIEARVRGGAARSVAVFLNDKPAGTWPLVKGEAHVVAIKLAEVPGAGSNGPQLVAGSNVVSLRFQGSARGGASPNDAQAELDWIHVGGQVHERDGSPEAYAAPTRADTVGDVTLGAAPMRAVLLRAPGYERCLGWLPATGRLVGSVGASGKREGHGEADVELRAVRDRAPPVVLASFHLAADAPWKAFDVALDKAMPSPAAGGKPVTGTLGAIELVAVRATPGTRVAFAEPRVLARPAPPPPPGAPQAAVPRAKNAVVLVLGNLAAGALAGANGLPALPEIGAIAKQGVVFDANRATSGAASGALASMLTGLPARAHGVVDDESGLAPDVTTLADLARQAGIRAAMFTSNPTTGSPFGFSRAWDTFVERSPSLDDPPGQGAWLASFDDATKWIDAQSERDKDGRFLVVVHARGGHPPWDFAPEQLKALPPPDYAGSIDPRRAAELLMRARPRTSDDGTRESRAAAAARLASAMHLTDADRTRAWALYGAALLAHDAAVGRLVATLKATGHDADTLLVVTGDAGLGDARAPFEDPDVLDEASLATPLVVRFPRGDAADAPFASAHVAQPTTSADVARTVVAAFGLAPPDSFGSSVDLAALAADPSPFARGRPEVAVFGARAALAWGTFVLRATLPDDASPDVSKLCDRSLEPACTSDVRAAFPLALFALRRELTAGPAHAPVPVVEPPPLRAALRLWGL